MTKHTLSIKRKYTVAFWKTYLTHQIKYLVYTLKDAIKIELTLKKIKTVLLPTKKCCSFLSDFQLPLIMWTHPFYKANTFFQSSASAKSSIPIGIPV